MSISAIRKNESITALNKVSFTGTDLADFNIVSGSRVIVSLNVTALGLGTTVVVTVGNAFNSEDGYETLDTITVTATGRSKVVIADFHCLVRLTATVTGGNASFLVGISVLEAPGEIAAADGSSEVTVINKLIPQVWDYYVPTFPNATTDVHTFKLGGASGSVQRVITIVYTDSTKAVIASLAAV